MQTDGRDHRAREERQPGPRDLVRRAVSAPPPREPGDPGRRAGDVPPRRRGPGKRPSAAGNVFATMVVTFLIWLLLAAPALRRSAAESPFGARRTAALVLLTPLDWVSHVLQLSRIDQAAESALGRSTAGFASGPGSALGNPPAGVDASPPRPRHSPKPGQTQPPPTQPPALRRPTKAHPLTILSIGDSIGIDLGFGLQRVMGGTGFYNVIVDGRISTGLARPDFFNWPARLQQDIARYHPDIVVMLVGLNDPQAMRVNGTFLPTFSRAWFDEYARRVDRILELGTADGRKMVWAGGPIVASTRLRHDMHELNGAYVKQVRLYQGAIYFNTWKYTSKDGAYTAFLTDPKGNSFAARTGDGTHFTNAGEDYMARILAQEIRADFLHRGPAPQ